MKNPNHDFESISSLLDVQPAREHGSARDTPYTVIGAGHGGKAMAAHLALMGFPVTLYNRTPDHIMAIQQRGGIELESYDGGPRGFGRLACVTARIDEALLDAAIIMVVVPSTAHAEIATLAAPYLRDGQMIVLHPGRTCGAIEFHRMLRSAGCLADLTIAEAETLLYASRSEGPAQARIFSIKEAVPLAALPATCTGCVLAALAPAYPQFIDGVNVLHTGLNNMGAMFHPALTILNAGRIEDTNGDFQFYMDDLHDAIHSQPGYKGIMAPATLNHRYITEDVPMSLVPIAELGHRYGVSVRGIESMIRLASIIHRTDYWRRGRTLDKLGIEGMSVSELTHYVLQGERDG